MIMFHDKKLCAILLDFKMGYERQCTDICMFEGEGEGVGEGEVNEEGWGRKKHRVSE